MRAGALRHQVTIQQPVETQNAYGEPKVRWQDVATGVWAGIEPIRGREFFAAKQINAEIEARVTLRHRTGMTEKMKIIHGAGCVCNAASTDEYLIDTIINVGERNRELQLMCTRFIE